VTRDFPSALSRYLASARAIPIASTSTEIAISCFNPSRHTNGDRNPSLRVNLAGGVWRCDVCGVGGGAIELVQGYEHCNAETANAKLRDLDPSATTTPSPVRSRRVGPGAKKKTSDQLRTAVLDYRAALGSPAGDEIRAWLVSTWRVSEAVLSRYVVGALAIDPWTPEGFSPPPRPDGTPGDPIRTFALACPSTSPDLHISGIKLYRPRWKELGGDDKGKAHALYGSTPGLFGGHLLAGGGATGRTVVIVGGEKDALVAASVLDPASFVVIANARGEGGWAAPRRGPIDLPRDFAEAIVRARPAGVVIALDVNEAARGAIDASAAFARASAPAGLVRAVSWPAAFAESSPKGGVAQFLLHSDPARAAAAAIDFRALLASAPIAAAPPAAAVPVASTASTAPPVHLTDLGNCLRLVSRHGEDIRFCAGLSSWLIWDGARWRIDEDGEIDRRAKSTISAIHQEAATATDHDEGRVLRKHAIASEANARINAMISLAQSEKRVSITIDALDQAAPRFVAANGTIDLTSGELRPHERRDLSTKRSLIDYDARAACPTWDRFLLEIMGGGSTGAELVAYLRRAVGYSLTGDVREHAIFFLYGNGSNGKSTFLEIVRAILGDYARNAEFETFFAGQRSPGSAREDLARLRGTRLVTAIEAPEGRRLDESLLKAIAGGDMLTARDLYKGSFEYRPQLKLWFSGNHKPVIKGTDDGIWRRFHLVPFLVKYHDPIPENAHLPSHLAKDLALPEKLRSELPGILAWAVRGCMEWQRVGLSAPSIVRSATQEYRTQMDTIGDFIRDRAIVSVNARVSSSELYTAYTSWCKGNGEKAASNTTFGLKMADRPGISKSRDRFGRMSWTGISVRKDNEGQTSSGATEGSEGLPPHPINSFYIADAREEKKELRDWGVNPSDPSVASGERNTVAFDREPGQEG
jgi:putative DNA primase/helicase